MKNAKSKNLFYFKHLSNFYLRGAATLKLRRLLGRFSSTPDSSYVLKNFAFLPFFGVNSFSKRGTLTAVYNQSALKFFKRQTNKSAESSSKLGINLLLKSKRRETPNLLYPYASTIKIAPNFAFYKFFDLRFYLQAKLPNFSSGGVLAMNFSRFTILTWLFFWISLFFFINIIFIFLVGYGPSFNMQTIYYFIGQIWYFAVFFGIYFQPNIYLLTTFFVDLSFIEFCVADFLQLLFNEWEVRAQALDFFYWVNFLPFFWGFAVIFLLYFRTILNNTRILFSFLSLRYDPWTIILRLYYSDDLQRTTPHLDELSRIYDDRLLNTFASSPDVFGPNTSNSFAYALQDYNLGLGFGGNVGFIDFFPSHTVKWHSSSFTKRRILLKRSHWDIQSFFKKLIMVKIDIASGLLQRNLRIFTRSNYNTLTKTNLTELRLSDKFFTRPRFKSTFFTNFFLRFLAAAILLPSLFGDLGVLRFRERFYSFTGINSDGWRIATIPTTVDRTNSQIFGTVVDWYHRELNAVVLSRTTFNQISARSSRVFRFGWQNLFNTHSFWRRPINIDARINLQNRSSKLNLVEREDDHTLGLDSALSFNEGLYDYTDDNREFMFDDNDVDPEKRLDLDEELYFESGFLHDDFALPKFDDEFFEWFNEGVFLRSQTHYDRQDAAATKFLSNPVFADGAGQEEDYTQIAPHESDYSNDLERTPSSVYQQSQLLSNFYDDVVDYLWINTSCRSYHNFLEYPAERFLNNLTLKAKKQKRGLLNARLKLGKFISFFSPFLATMLLPSFKFLYWDFFASIGSGLLALAVFFSVPVSIFLFPHHFTGAMPWTTLLSITYFIVIFVSIFVIGFCFIDGRQILSKFWILLLSKFWILLLALIFNFSSHASSGTSIYTELQKYFVSRRPFHALRTSEWPITLKTSFDFKLLPALKSRRQFLVNLHYENFSNFNAKRFKSVVAHKQTRSLFFLDSLRITDKHGLVVKSLIDSATPHPFLVYDTSTLYSGKHVFLKQFTFSENPKTIEVLPMLIDAQTAWFEAKPPLLSPSNTIFNDFLRVIVKRKLLYKNNNRVTTQRILKFTATSIDGTRNNFFTKSLNYYKSIVVYSSMESPPVQLPTADVLLPKPTVLRNSFFYYKDLAVKPTFAPRFTQEYKFFARGLFGDGHVHTSKSYANMFRLIFSDFYLSSVYFRRTQTPNDPVLSEDEFYQTQSVARQKLIASQNDASAKNSRNSLFF